MLIPKFISDAKKSLLPNLFPHSLTSSLLPLTSSLSTVTCDSHTYSMGCATSPCPLDFVMADIFLVSKYVFPSRFQPCKYSYAKFVQKRLNFIKDKK